MKRAQGWPRDTPALPHPNATFAAIPPGVTSAVLPRLQPSGPGAQSGPKAAGASAAAASPVSAWPALPSQRQLRGLPPAPPGDDAAALVQLAASSSATASAPPPAAQLPASGREEFTARAAAMVAAARQVASRGYGEDDDGDDEVDQQQQHQQQEEDSWRLSQPQPAAAPAAPAGKVPFREAAAEAVAVAAAAVARATGALTGSPAKPPAGAAGCPEDSLAGRSPVRSPAKTAAASAAALLSSPPQLSAVGDSPMRGALDDVVASFFAEIAAVEAQGPPPSPAPPRSPAVARALAFAGSRAAADPRDPEDSEAQPRPRARPPLPAGPAARSAPHALAALPSVPPEEEETEAEEREREEMPRPRPQAPTPAAGARGGAGPVGFRQDDAADAVDEAGAWMFEGAVEVAGPEAGRFAPWAHRQGGPPRVAGLRPGAAGRRRGDHSRQGGSEQSSDGGGSAAAAGWGWDGPPQPHAAAAAPQQPLAHPSALSTVRLAKQAAALQAAMSTLVVREQREQDRAAAPDGGGSPLPGLSPPYAQGPAQLGGRRGAGAGGGPRVVVADPRLQQQGFADLPIVIDSVPTEAPRLVGKQVDSKWLASRGAKPALEDLWSREHRAPQVSSTRGWAVPLSWALAPPAGQNVEF